MEIRGRARTIPPEQRSARTTAMIGGQWTLDSQQGINPKCQERSAEGKRDEITPSRVKIKACTKHILRSNCITVPGEEDNLK